MSEATEQPERVEVHFDWRAAEYGQVVQQLTRERMRSRGWRLTFLLGSAVAGWQLIQVAYYGIISGSWLWLVSALPWILFFVLWAWILTRGVGWQAARRAQKLDPRTGDSQTHRIDRDGIFVDTGSGSLALPWDGMSDVKETPDHFLWYWHKEMAHYTPKRALSGDEIDRLRSLIARYSVPDGG